MLELVYLGKSEWAVSPDILRLSDPGDIICICSLTFNRGTLIGP